jgi:hypothetical protein
VVLLSYGLQSINSGVSIYWSTSSEINNDYFTLERSHNGVDFTIIEIIEGRGNSTELNRYEYVDRQPVPGISYYRLSQTDFDGSREFFKILTANAYQLKSDRLMIYPNPVSGGKFSVSAINLGSNDAIMLEISDIAGRGLFSQNAYTDHEGRLIVMIEDILPLKKGTYILRLENKYEHLVKRFVTE